MRLKLLATVVILSLAGSSDGRPQQLEVSASLQPKIENGETEGWRPIQRDARLAQDPIPAGKDLPLVVEGNSRYTDEARTSRRKSYFTDHPFYGDHIPLYGNQKTSDRSYEHVNLAAFESDVSKRPIPMYDTKTQVHDEVAVRGRNNGDVKISSRYTIRRNKIESGKSIGQIDFKNNEMSSETAEYRKLPGSVIDEASTNEKSNLGSSMIKNLGNTAQLLEDRNFLDINRNPNLRTLHRRKISSHYSRGRKPRPLLPKTLSNVDYFLSSNPNMSSPEPGISDNESQGTMVDSVNVRPQVTLDSSPIADSYEPVHGKKEKIMNFVKILTTYSDPYDSENKTMFLQSILPNLHDNRNQVSIADSYHSKSGVKQSENNFNHMVNGFNRLANQATKHQFDVKNSTKYVKTKPQAVGSPPSIMKTKNQEHSKNNMKNSLRPRPNSSQDIPDLKLKNWPNGNLQSLEDLYNYERYTSFQNDRYDHLEAQEISGDATPHKNSANIHKGTKKADKKPGSNPSILIFDHSMVPTQTVQNNEADAATIYNSESHVNVEQSGQEVVQWEQIHPVTSNNNDFLVADINGAEPNAFDPIPEGLQPNRPLNPDRDQTQSTNHYGYADESLPGENPPYQMVHNYGNGEVQGEEYFQNQHDQPIFENPNLENGAYPVEVTGPTSVENESDGISNGHQSNPVYTQDLSKQPYFNPTSVVTQNTVVHILNAGKKRPNVTVADMKVDPQHSTSSLNPKDRLVDNENSSVSTPNVHIMFTTQDDNEEGDGSMVIQRVPEVIYEDSVNCPIIKINSYTRINNTVQGKEGCTDLNIIINSHILNTNVFKPAENYGSENTVPSAERYPGNVQAQPSYGIADGGYVTSEGSYGTSPTETGQNTGGYAPSDFQDFPVSGGQIPQDNLQDGQSPSTSTFEVFQQTQINVGSLNDAPGSGEALNPGVSSDPSTPGDGLSDVPSSPGAGTGGEASIPGTAPETGVLNDPVSPTGAADDAVVAGDPAVGGGVPAFPSFDETQPPFADAPGEVAADAPLSPGTGGSSGIQFPQLPQLPQLPGGNNPLSSLTSQLSQGGGSGSDQGGGPGSVLGDDDDDDDEDMLDLMPFSIIESVTSMLPYFTLLNPLNYGFLSFAISPFAVAAAGIFGLAAVFVPFAFSRAFSNGRAGNQVTITVKPNLEEVVTESIHQYENWNEWKSKRKKRKR